MFLHHNNSVSILKLLYQPNKVLELYQPHLAKYLTTQKGTNSGYVS